MAFEIQLDEIGDYYRESLRLLVVATCFEAEGRLKKETPVDTGRLRNGWQSNVPQRGLMGGAGKLEGSVTNNVEYAEAVCYGTNLPPSWGGEYKTKQGTKPGFPDRIAKELEPWVKREFDKIQKRRGN